MLIPPDDLISRLQSASAPSRELDVEIYRQLIEPLASPFKEYIGSVWIEANRGIIVPRYTESIDAALMLVDKGNSWDVGTYVDRFQSIVRGKVAIAATPAIALVIACLKAGKENSKP